MVTRHGKGDVLNGDKQSTRERRKEKEEVVIEEDQDGDLGSSRSTIYTYMRQL